MEIVKAMLGMNYPIREDRRDVSKFSNTLCQSLFDRVFDVRFPSTASIAKK